MAIANQKYQIDWCDHANNLSKSFNDLFEQNEMVDVTLVAEGYLFSAHRLVLATLSPYFRKMFNQMPANQQAFVFMKDVSKQTLEYLIAFIYRGEVNVNHADLEEFFNTAKALEIKGLTNESYAQLFNNQMPNSTYCDLIQNAFQYQSSQTVQILTPVNLNQTPTNYCQQSLNGHQEQNHFEIGKNNEIGNNHHDYDDTDIGNNGLDGDDVPKDREFHVQSDQWVSNYYDNGIDADEKPLKMQNVHKAKRTKKIFGTAAYNVIADIRKKSNGRDNLFYNGYKFSKNGKGLTKQVWQCTRSASAKCKSTMTTMMIDGVMKMKVLKGEHTHGPDQ